MTVIAKAVLLDWVQGWRKEFLLDFSTRYGYSIEKYCHQIDGGRSLENLRGRCGGPTAEARAGRRERKDGFLSAGIVLLGRTCSDKSEAVRLNPPMCK